VISRSLLSQSNSLIIFDMSNPVHGLNFRYGVGDLKPHFIIEKYDVSQVWEVGNISARVKWY